MVTRVFRPLYVGCYKRLKSTIIPARALGQVIVRAVWAACP